MHRPKKFYPLFQIVIPKGAINPIQNNDLVIPYVHVFEYTYTETQPSLGTQWVPSPSELASWPKPLTLHVLSEELFPLSGEHPEKAFGTTCRLLGASLDLDPSLSTTFKSANTQEPFPPNMENRLFEFAPLDARRHDLLTIAQGKEKTGRLVDPWENLPRGSGNIEELASKWFFGHPGPFGNEACLQLSAAGRSAAPSLGRT
jgi:hypothetical protein